MKEAPDDAAQDPRESPNVQAMSEWDRVIADMEATAEEYRQRGWDTTELHPGDIAVVDPSQATEPGIDVLLPTDEFETLEDRYTESAGFTSVEAFQAGGPDFVYLLLALEARADEWAVLVPVYYEVTEDTIDLFEHAIDVGQLHVFLRELSGEQILVTHQDPELIAPEAATPGTLEPVSEDEPSEDPSDDGDDTPLQEVDDGDGA